MAEINIVGTGINGNDKRHYLSFGSIERNKSNETIISAAEETLEFVKELFAESSEYRAYGDGPQARIILGALRFTRKNFFLVLKAEAEAKAEAKKAAEAVKKA